MTIKSKKEEKTKVKKSEEKVKREPGQLVDPEKLKAQGVIHELQKENPSFGSNFKGFKEIYIDTMKEVQKYHKLMETSKEEMKRRREELLAKMKLIIPLLKSKLGNEGTKYRIAFIITTQLESVEGTSLSTIRRLLERYEEEFGAIYPKALEDKSAEETDTTEGTQNHIDIVYALFGKGKEELLALVEKIRSAIEEDKFDRLVINLNANRHKIKGIQLVVKGND